MNDFFGILKSITRLYIMYNKVQKPFLMRKPCFCFHNFLFVTQGNQKYLEPIQRVLLNNFEFQLKELQVSFSPTQYVFELAIIFLIW